jgi:hypothetical protein
MSTVKEPMEFVSICTSLRFAIHVCDSGFSKALFIRVGRLQSL